MDLQSHGAKKYPESALLKSSAGLGWSTIAAELRSHGVSSTPVIVPQHTEVILAVAGNDNGLVSRAGAGQLQEHTPTTGSISLTPIAVGDNEARFTAPIPAMLHLYLPTLLFRRLSDDFNLPGMPGFSIRYLAGVQDEIINQVGLSVVSEMTNESAAGRMFVETASLMLAAHLLRKYCDSGSCKSFESTAHRLDHARLRRVLDYISVHLADEITVAELARVSGLSTFHFARMFTLVVGISPNRYVSRLRLEQAMADVAAGKLSLAQIAFKSGFSSQASFTRAFRRATGITPGEYRSDRR
jgi:AraC family transcriptional regulator